MQLDSMEAVIRPRSAWEATDLGMLMAARWWWPMTKAWLVVTLPIYLLLHLLPGAYWVAPLIFWWFKPIWERIHLHIVSRALFGHVPGIAETIREFRKVMFKRFFASLLWGRLSQRRSMDAPLMQLEGLKGERRKQRLKLLHAEDDTPAGYMLIAGATIETMLMLSFVVLLSMLIPEEMDSTLGRALLAPDGAFISIAENMLLYVATTLVAPFYVAGGFALYLNRRVKLEAWDIEIGFKKLAAARAAPKTSTFARVALLALMCALPLADRGSQAQAAEADAPATVAYETGARSVAAARARVDAVMARDEFHERIKRPTPEMDAELQATLSRWLQQLFDWLGAEDSSNNGTLFASTIEVLLWSALAGIIVVLLFTYRHWLYGFVLQKRKAPEIVTTSYTPTAARINLRNQQLPVDVAAACRALWQQGEKLEAVALLYRASLVVFMRAHRCSFPDSTTEGEHLAKVRATLAPATSAYFGDLSRIWLFLAYGKSAPDEAQLLALCDSWQRDWEHAVQQQAAVGTEAQG